MYILEVFLTLKLLNSIHLFNTNMTVITPYFRFDGV